jgi:PAS domain S-box-containing protein
MWVYDLKTLTFLDVNLAAMEKYGYTREEFLGMTLKDIQPAEYKTRLLNGTEKVQTAVEDFSECRHTLKDGRVIDVAIISYKVEYYKHDAILVAATGITERKRAEEALRKSEERYRALATSSPDPLYVHIDGRVTLVNPAMCQLLGAEKPSQVIGKSVFEIVDSNYHEIVRKRLDMMFKGHPVPLLEEKYIRLDGTAVDVDVTAVAIDLGGHEEVLVVARDISERKRAEEALKDSVNRLHLLEQRLERIREDERKTISREVHDELGTVLSAIRFDLFALRDLYSKEGKGFTDKVQSIIELIDGVMVTVQDISARLRPGVLDRLGLIAAIEWQAEKFQEHTNIACALHLPESEPAIDEERSTVLFRILQETLTNVARHAHAKHVEISFSETETEFSLIVADDGVGIPEGKLHDPNSLGLLGIHERLYPFKGICIIRSPQGGGTEINVHLPKKPS